MSKQGVFDHTTELGLIFENLVYSVCELANIVAGIVAFCLLVWGLLEWVRIRLLDFFEVLNAFLQSSHASELLRPSMPPFPLPSRARALHFRVNPSLCEPRDQHVAVLQFLSEQIQHAKALSSLSISLGLPLRAFLEAHRAT